MSILKSLVRDAVADGVRKGIGKAVGQAVGDAIRPSMEKMAQDSADFINSSSESISKSASEAQAASAEAKQQVQAAGGFAALESALGGLTSKAERYAVEMTKNMKMCPTCGQACSSDKEFCPYCGAKLPEQTIADTYTCKKCGNVNAPDTKYCTKCGAILPAFEAAEKAQKEKDDAVLAELAARCPAYPAWNVGGRCFELNNYGPRNGFDSYVLTFEGKRDVVDRYFAVLREAGFVNKGLMTMYKDVGGVCRAVDLDDTSCETDQTIMFYVGNYIVKPQPAAKKPQEDTLSSLAKGLLKKIKF